MAGYGWVPPPSCAGSFSWAPCSGGQVPPMAVHAGQDGGLEIFAGRAFHNGDLLPAKVIPGHGCAYVSWGGDEIRVQDYEVLVSSHVAWRAMDGGSIPSDAIVFGTTVDGERLYMGRALFEGTLTPGKVHPSHGVLYIPFGGREVSIPQYEVLVLT